MSRYIDADALGKNIIEKYSGRSNGKAIATMALDIINNAPTTDVVEVKNGKNISDSGFLCNVCSFGDFGGFHGYEPNYCPNCGTKMERSEE